MENYKYLPPKYSYALKDLSSFLGIFEMTEEEYKRRRLDVSETSSQLSHVTATSAFKPKGKLDVIAENQVKEDDAEDIDSPAKINKLS